MRKGQWSCEQCAAANGHSWGVPTPSAEKGWCGISQHRVQTRLEWIPGADPIVEIRRYVFPEPSATSTPTFTPSVKAADAPAPAVPAAKQMELFQR